MSDEKIEYKETPIDPKSPALKRLAERIKQSGFNFHPGKILAELDKEAERQFMEICKDILRGQSVKAIQDIQGEVYEWMESEDTRFAAFKASNLAEKSPLEISDIGMTPVFTQIEEESPVPSDALEDGSSQDKGSSPDEGNSEEHVEKFKVESIAKSVEKKKTKKK